MKKLLLLFALFTGAGIASAATLPAPQVSGKPSEIGWFDYFSVSYWQSPNVPYTLSIVNTKGIKFTKNLVEDIPFSVQLVQFQEDEDTPLYEDVYFLVGTSDIQFEVGATFSLYVPAGALLVHLSETESVPNEAINYSFVLQEQYAQPPLPDPDITPAPGEVAQLNVVKLSWKGVLPGFLDLLNAMENIEENYQVDPVSMYDGEVVTYPEVSFEWSSRDAVTPGSAGDIMVLTLTDEETLADGEYMITIPAGYLQITDVETGTQYQEEPIEFGYTVDSSLVDDPNEPGNGEGEGGNGEGDNGDEEGEDGDGVLSIQADSAKKSVYNLNGVKVGIDTTNLPKGVYIINGKKVIK